VTDLPHPGYGVALGRRWSTMFELAAVMKALAERQERWVASG
jgi:hypothetical protein